MRQPRFWYTRAPVASAISALLRPLGAAFAAIGRHRRRHRVSYHSRLPVICVGNLTVGGTGKTPTVIGIARMLQQRGLRPALLTRGYGGRIRGAEFVSTVRHSSVDVGDEALLLAGASPTIVARDRSVGAKLAEESDADVIVMDDGHQNGALHKTLALVVVDAETGFGNGEVLPAGPLREPIDEGLARADAIVLVGDGEPPMPTNSLPIFRAHIVPSEPAGWRGRRVIAFAGIGRPEKFFHTLRTCGAEIKSTAEFSDHHVFSAAELSKLHSDAIRSDCTLVTTEKDWIRLPLNLREDVIPFPVQIRFVDPGALQAFLRSRLGLAE